MKFIEQKLEKAFSMVNDQLLMVNISERSIHLSLTIYNK